MVVAALVSPLPYSRILRSRLRQGLALAGLTWGLWGAWGWMPPTAGPLALPPSLSAIAQAQTTVSDQEVTQYARAVLQMDVYRNEAFGQARELLRRINIDPSNVSLHCAQMTLPRMPRAVRRQVEDIVTTYCNQAQEIVAQNGLTAQRFNEITVSHRENEALANRIRQELSRLQAEQQE